MTVNLTYLKLFGLLQLQLSGLVASVLIKQLKEPVQDKHDKTSGLRDTVTLDEHISYAKLFVKISE